MVINSPDGLIYVQNWVNRKGFINFKFFQSIARTPRQYLGESEHNHIFCATAFIQPIVPSADAHKVRMSRNLYCEWIFLCFQATFFHNFFYICKFFCLRSKGCCWLAHHVHITKSLSFTWCDIYSHNLQS